MQIINSTNQKPPVNIEILERNYVSRLYYTAYLHCASTLDLLGNNVPGEDSHNKVIKSLKNEYYQNMVHLKALRKKADYELTEFSQPFKFKSSTVRIQRLKAVLEDILNQNEQTLSSS